MIDAESLYSNSSSSIQRTNSFSSFFLTPYSTTATRRFCSSSTELRVLLFSSSLLQLLRLRQHQVSQHTHSSYEGTEEYERNPTYFRFFDTLNYKMNFTHWISVCIGAYVTWSGKTREKNMMQSRFSGRWWWQRSKKNVEKKKMKEEKIDLMRCPSISFFFYLPLYTLHRL